MALREKYETEIQGNKQLQSVALANTKGGDKTPIAADGGLDLSADEKLLKKSRGGELGNVGGYTPSKPYSSISRD